MSKTDDGGQAFPMAARDDALRGMSLRDYIAAKTPPAAYSEMCRNCNLLGWPDNWRDGIAENSYRMADAMLAERSKCK